MNLSEYILSEIFSFLSEKDLIKSVYRVCKDYKNLIEGSSYLLGIVTKNTLGLAGDFMMDFVLFQRIFEKIHSSSSDELGFKGFATSGGYDEDHASYWVANLYKNDGSYYCSRDNKLNINTAGVLELALSLTGEEEEEKCEYILRILREVEIIANSIYPRFKKHNTLGPAVKRAFQQLFSMYRNEIVGIVSQTFEEAPQIVAAKILKEIKGMKIDNIDSIKLRRRQEDSYVLVDGTDIQQVAKSKLRAVISEVEVSREGGFTCPLETFIVLCSEKYIDIEDESFDQYNNILTYDQLCQAFPNQVSALNSTPNTLSCTFSKSIQDLKPLAWGKFISRQGDVLKIPIPYKSAAKYLYLKLLNPENRMAEMGDNHDFTNIDCNYIIARGHIISF